MSQNLFSTIILNQHPTGSDLLCCCTVQCSLNVIYISDSIPVLLDAKKWSCVHAEQCIFCNQKRKEDSRHDAALTKSLIPGSNWWPYACEAYVITNYTNETREKCLLPHRDTRTEHIKKQALICLKHIEPWPHAWKARILTTRPWGKNRLYKRSWYMYSSNAYYLNIERTANRPLVKNWGDHVKK